MGPFPGRWLGGTTLILGPLVLLRAGADHFAFRLARGQGAPAATVHVAEARGAYQVLSCSVWPGEGPEF